MSQRSVVSCVHCELILLLCNNIHSLCMTDCLSNLTPRKLETELLVKKKKLENIDPCRAACFLSSVRAAVHTESSLTKCATPRAPDATAERPRILDPSPQFTLPLGQRAATYHLLRADILSSQISRWPPAPAAPSQRLRSCVPARLNSTGALGIFIIIIFIISVRNERVNPEWPGG